jgi:AmiR/NasT family two-component response regulator
VTNTLTDQLETTHPPAEDELAAARHKIEHLEIALQTARQIGIAIGIVMSTYKLKPDDAFALLVRLSQRTHRKLRDIALDVIDTGSLDVYPA